MENFLNEALKWYDDVLLALGEIRESESNTQWDKV